MEENPCDAVLVKIAGSRNISDKAVNIMGCTKRLADSANTVPTSHDRIRIAKVRAYEYDNARMTIDELESLSRAVDISTMVAMMKNTVPEYHTEEKY